MDVIGALLRSSLLTELGDDEDRVQRIRAAEQALSIELAGKSRGLIPHAVIAALDASTPAAATPLATAEKVLLDEWVTFRNAFPERPTEILRALVLAAVARAAASDDALQQAAWYSLRSAVECLPVGRWAEPIAELAAEWDDAVSPAVATLWQPSPAAARLRMPTVAKVDLEKIAIKTPLRDRSQQLQENGNYNNFAQSLQADYASHVDQLVGVSEILSAEAYKRSVAQLREFVSLLGGRLREVIGVHDQRVNAVLLRSELLWWRQTAFSARLSRAYGDLSVADAAIAAAVDLHSIVPAIAPLAVEHLLADLTQDVTKRAELNVAALAEAEQASQLVGSPEPTPLGFIDAISSAVDTPLVPPGQALSASRAAVLIFRDLQARRLADTSPPEQLGDSE
ncbi:GTPase-associated system all-helical protein GASH [Pseudosporangium ferrugineum]|uniref:GTPase-associated system helical domain-containing protein n=1 Tax=Pseudosporangium ferrugineum TaxID=439699 RepID=A0A2T0RFR4_9ACTN|nr:GTPase-associated system all-helical protein GASH [Pseudosporangium ferrugineum]PRY19987.1 hypothetical protein CLV70_12625 [Pseudosporangium ferrugineum]